MSYSSRFWLYAPLAMFFAIAAWAATDWVFHARDLDATLKASNGRQAIPGVSVSWASQTISGFPFRYDVTLNGLQVRAEAPRGPLIWRSDNFAAHALAVGRDQSVFEAAGEQALSWTDADGGRHTLSFLPGSLRASAIFDGKGLARFDLDLLNAAGKDSTGAVFTAGRAQFHMRRNPKSDALDLALNATEIKDPATPFGDHVESLTLYSQINQASAFSRLLAGKAGWMDALMTWRHLGGAVIPGTVDIRSSALTTKSAGPDLEPGLRALLFPFY